MQQTSVDILPNTAREYYLVYPNYFRNTSTLVLRAKKDPLLAACMIEQEKINKSAFSCLHDRASKAFLIGKG